MISKIHEGFIKFFIQYLKDYGINDISAIYNSDIELIHEYIKNIRVRDVDYAKKMIDDIVEENKLSKNILFYKYSPLQKAEGRTKTYQIYFNEPKSDWNEVDVEKEVEEIYKKKYINNSEDKYIVRDLFFGKVSYDFTLITNNLEILNYFQTLYLSKFVMRNPKFSMVINLPELDEPIEIESLETNFSELQDLSHIDYMNYGNVYTLSFSVDMVVPVISDYYVEEDQWKEVVIDVFIDDKNWSRMENI